MGSWRIRNAKIALAKQISLLFLYKAIRRSENARDGALANWNKEAGARGPLSWEEIELPHHQLGEWRTIQ